MTLGVACAVSILGDAGTQLMAAVSCSCGWAARQVCRLGYTTLSTASHGAHPCGVSTEAATGACVWRVLATVLLPSTGARLERLPPAVAYMHADSSRVEHAAPVTINGLRLWRVAVAASNTAAPAEAGCNAGPR